MSFRNVILFTMLVLFPIAIGTAIYVGWRTTSLLVFDWMALFGIPHDVFRPAVNLPSPILYSLPDGCWVLAGTTWMLLIWRSWHPWVFVFAALAIGGEFGQAFDFVPGTFEWTDVCFYLGGFILALIGFEYAKTLSLHSRVVGYGHSRCG